MHQGLDSAVHWVLLLIAAPISVWTLRQGLKTHRQRRWLAIGVCGLVLMLAGVLLHTAAHSEMWLTVAGVLVLAFAHTMNWSRALRPRNCKVTPLRSCSEFQGTLHVDVPQQAREQRAA
jgi:hypothetical protein